MVKNKITKTIKLGTYLHSTSGLENRKCSVNSNTYYTCYNGIFNYSRSYSGKFNMNKSYSGMIENAIGSSASGCRNIEII